LQNTHYRAAGLDVGFSENRPTAGIGVWADEDLQLSHCLGVVACERILATGRVDMVAIDGPIIPKGQDVTQTRSVERLFAKGLFQTRCKPGMSHVRGTGIRLRQEAGKAADILASSTSGSRITTAFPRVREAAIVEAFPNAFLGVCLGEDVFARIPLLKRGKKFEWLYNNWREHRLVERLPGLTSNERAELGNRFHETRHHEQQAAIVCVLTALLVARSKFTAVGEKKGGWFFLPPWEYWQTWAKDAVSAGIRGLNREGAQLEVVTSG
jgi:hypothetical protein